MGFMDKIGNMFGGSKPKVTDSVKPAGQVLRENGIDTANLNFKYNQDGSVAVSGAASSQQECDRICELIKEMPTTTSVQNNMTVSVPEPAPVPAPEPVPEAAPAAQAEAPAPQESAAEAEEKGKNLHRTIR